MHVMGDGSQLDLGLRGLAAPASATGLALPAGEAVARSYECQLFGGGIFPPWGQLHLCSSVVLFDSDECPRRVSLSFSPLYHVPHACTNSSLSLSCTRAHKHTP